MLNPTVYDQSFFKLPVLYSSKEEEIARRGIKRILVLDSGILLDQLITLILSDDPCLDIWVQPLDTEERVAGLIDVIHPESVILSCGSTFSVSALKRLISARQPGNCVDIVTISLDDNSLDINDERRLAFSNFRNFVELVKMDGLVQ